MFLNYHAVLDNSIQLINHCCSTCDTFSVVTIQKKPYNLAPPISESDYFDTVLHDFLINQTANVRGWPGTTIRGKGPRYILRYYLINSKVKIILKETFKNIFLYQGKGFPQDICFYRGRNVFLLSSTHEKVIALDSYRADDLVALKDYIQP